MAVLSKEDILRRILIGEMLICPKMQRDKIAKCLPNTDDAKARREEYFKNLVSNPANLSRRKRVIKEYIEKNFLGQNRNDIIKFLEETENMKKYVEEEYIENLEPPIFIHDIDFENCLRNANYDLRLGEEVYVTTDRVPRKLNAMGNDGVVSIEPGEFGILMTHEYLFVPPDLMGFISIRLSHKQKGLVNISGFHVDPGFYGKLMFAVFNAGPNDVPLRYIDRVFMIMFNKLTEDGPKVEKGKFSGMDNIPIETLSGLRGASVSVRSLNDRVRRLELLFPILLTGIAGLLVGLIVYIVTHWPAGGG